MVAKDVVSIANRKVLRNTVSTILLYQYFSANQVEHFSSTLRIDRSLSRRLKSLLTPTLTLDILSMTSIIG